jgi:uncharacterized membrane protein
VGLFVAAYVHERAADRALEDLKQATRNGEFNYYDAAVVRHDAEGKVHISETGDMSAGYGAGIGAFMGGVMGLLGGLTGAVVGAAAGAAIGGLTAAMDAGFSDESLKEIGAALPAGTSALAVTTSQDFVVAVHKQATEQETLTLARDIAAEIGNHLNARQDVLMAMVLTERGVAAQKVVSSPSQVAVFGIASTPEWVAARTGVAREEGAAAADAAAVPVEEEDEA